MPCVYHGRTKDESCGHLKIDLSPPSRPPPPPHPTHTHNSTLLLIVPRECFCCGLPCHCTVFHMKRLNQTESPIFVALCVSVFKRKIVLDIFICLFIFYFILFYLLFLFLFFMFIYLFFDSCLIAVLFVFLHIVF